MALNPLHEILSENLGSWQGRRFAAIESGREKGKCQIRNRPQFLALYLFYQIEGSL